MQAGDQAPSSRPLPPQGRSPGKGCLWRGTGRKSGGVCKCKERSSPSLSRSKISRKGREGVVFQGPGRKEDHGEQRGECRVQAARGYPHSPEPASGASPLSLGALGQEVPERVEEGR